MTEDCCGGENERRADQPGSAPLAWIWSQYKGVLADNEVGCSVERGEPARAAGAPTQIADEFPETTGDLNSSLEAEPLPLTRDVRRRDWHALALAAAIVVIGGLTWFFTTSPASNPMIGTTSKEASPPAASNEEATAPAKLPVAAPAGEAVGIENKLRSFLEQGREKTAIFELDGVLFEAGKATLATSSHEQLQQLARILSAFPKARIVIAVHSDSGGTKAGDAKLSSERAKSVRSELVRLGVGRSLLASKGAGKELAPTSRGSSESQNRDGHAWVSVRKN